jgi:hypothetical protein
VIKTIAIRVCLLAASLCVAFIFWTALWQVGRAQITASAPDIIVTTGVTNGAAVSIAGVNPGRRAFQICAATNSIFFAPVNPPGMPVVTPTTTSGVPVAAGACFTSALLTASGTSGGMGAAFQAIGNSGTAVVSFLEY